MKNKITCEDTSKSCLINLVNANVEEAIKINKYLNFKAATNNKTINKASAVFQEIRYRFINYYIKKSGYKNILDIGCGYSPRTIEFLPEGYKYVGIELDEVVDKISKAQKEILSKNDYENVKYHSVKLTDIHEIVNAASEFVGPVCIVIEGVLMYFTAEELSKTFEAFKIILEKNGGCIITPDYMTNMMMKTSFVTFAGPILGRLMLKASYIVVKKYLEKTNDKYMDPLKQFKDDSDMHAIEYFSNKGFKIKRVPLFAKDMKMSSLDSLDQKSKILIKKFEKLYGWIMEI